MTSPFKILPALVLFLVKPAFAMCVSTHYLPVAWSADGQVVLIREAATGPEGGGAITFLLIDFRKPKSETFALSSNFKEGDESDPETISDETCAATAAKANQAFVKAGLGPLLKAEVKACKKDRGELLKSKDKKDYTLDFEKVAQIASQVGLPGKGASATAFTKNGRNSIIIENDQSCDARCYRVRPGPKEGTYKNDGPCE